MFLNVDVEQLKKEVEEVILQALTESGNQDFLHLGSWCDKDRDIRNREALAWKSLNKVEKIWKIYRGEPKDHAFQSEDRNNPSLRVPDLGPNSPRGETTEWKIHPDAEKDRVDKNTINGGL